MVFDVLDSPKSTGNNKDLYINTNTQFFREDRILAITDTMFNRGSLAFNPNPFSKVTLVHEPAQNKYFSAVFKDFLYLGIWLISESSKFICIEHWYGFSEYRNNNKEFTEKTGVLKLEPKGNFTCEFTIKIL